MRIVRITKEDAPLLEKFLSNAGNSLNSFRYFSKRSTKILDQHKITLLIINENEIPVAYGHLDCENEIIWLGNCVIEIEKGKGWGQLMMRSLLNFARDKKINNIRLSVDNSNSGAIKLYQKFGFQLLERKGQFSFYEWKLEENPEILISSLAFAGMTTDEIIKKAEEENICLEFSSGMPYRDDMENLFLRCSAIKYAHNYFPAPREPFVLNLASSNEIIRRKSIEHCINGILLSYRSGARFFSAHAGFCIDPSPAELGNPLNRKKINDRNENWNLFLASLKEIFASTFWTNTSFLIENNVLAKMNLYEDGTNPLFCCDPDEINRLINEMNEPRLGILLDTGHLKVSANTLGFDLSNSMAKIENCIRGLHHSDNNGEFDTNDNFNENYWFLPYMKKFRHLTHVIEVKKINLDAVRKSIFLLKNSAS